MKRIIHIGALAGLSVIVLAFTGCEKPRLKAKAEGGQEAAEENLPEMAEKQEPGEPTPKPEAPSEPKVAEKAKAPTAPKAPKSVPKPSIDPKEHAALIARVEAGLQAQVAGIRSLESDLSRHSVQLNELRRQLGLARARQSGAGGGVRVERIQGKSTLVNHAAVVRELQGKIRIEEELVTQLTKSLTGARSRHQELTRELIRLKNQGN